ncbi:hypothetical protein RRG08_030046 [Elysia crispata]|uniref:Uncharacterized protein n=1 Tax=Elysia crispata TaxID=231223 RepID=A0AAE0XY84_9GAST|nr:hypothetical protein RRG08_030046 [Elysia crispata]
MIRLDVGTPGQRGDILRHESGGEGIFSGTSRTRNNDQAGRCYTRAERGYFEARVGAGTMIRLDVGTPGRRGDILRHESAQEQ